MLAELAQCQGAFLANSQVPRKVWISDQSPSFPYSSKTKQVPAVLFPL
jgi:hypothetical protein